MTRVDFYILDNGSGDAALQFVCRLAEKAVAQEHEVLINTPDAGASARLDDLLWTFSQGSFLPHRRLGADGTPDEGEPIVIGCGDDPPGDRWDLLINLAVVVPDFFSRFERVAEIVGSDEQNKAAGRERFRYYRDRGYELRTHRV